jgi:alkylation response protein AidB-like acyl-CoA dehydrogenase
VSSNVSERQAREVAEAAREAEWKLPSFGKELFLGNFRPDLIHPQPRLDPAAVEKGERFLEQLRDFLESDVDPLEIERDAKIPEPVIDGLKRIGALGMKVPEEYGGLGLSQVYDSYGVTVEHRNAFMGLRGIENSVTRLDHVFVPEENRIGREGDGLKIALTTLNTGRLALPAICVGMAKWATKIAREWSIERVQWGRPIGKHDAVAQKLAFIAGSAFGLEAMLDVASRLADNKSGDIRIEAAIAKLYGSEMGWKVLDELIQVRGGRGYETAASLKARGEKPVPAEQALRDMRINRVFEGSTEIMHLLIAREAVDQHLKVAGELLEPGGEIKDRLASAGRAGLFYSKWLPQLAVGKGQVPSSFDEFGSLAPYMRFAERSSRRLARSTFYGMTRWQAKLEYRQAFLGRLVDIGAELFAIAATAAYADTLGRERPERRTEAQELAELFCIQAKRRVETLFGQLWDNDDDANRTGAARVLDGRYRWLEEGVVDPSGDGPMIPAEVKQPASAPAP